MTDTHEDDIREDDVMVGFSNSAVSAAALRWAVAEGARIGCRVRVVHVYDEAERADARLEAAASQDASSIDPGRVLGRLGDAAHEACITVSQEGGDLEDTLRRASAGARVLAIGKPGDCRHPRARRPSQRGRHLPGGARPARLNNGQARLLGRPLGTEVQ